MKGQNVRTIIIWTCYASIVFDEEARAAGVAGIAPDRLVGRMAELGSGLVKCGSDVACASVVAIANDPLEQLLSGLPNSQELRRPV